MRSSPAATTTVSASGTAATLVITTPVRGCTLLPITLVARTWQPGLLERLPHRGVLRALARLDLPAREHPWRVPVPAPADQHAQAAGDDRRSHHMPLVVVPAGY